MERFYFEPSPGAEYAYRRFYHGDVAPWPPAYAAPAARTYEPVRRPSAHAGAEDAHTRQLIWLLGSVLALALQKALSADAFPLIVILTLGGVTLRTTDQGRTP